MKVVRMSFPTGERQYDYYVQPGDNPEVGDFAVVNIGEVCGRGYNLTEAGRPNIARIDGILIEGAPHKATKPYLFLIPLKTIQERKALFDQFAAHAETQRLARQRLRDMLKEHFELDQFAKLAAVNPEAAKMLALVKSQGPTMAIESDAG